MSTRPEATSTRDRWARNEGSWGDVLDGSKELPWENLRQAQELDDHYDRDRRRSRGIRFLGIRISWDEDEDEITSATSGIRFGHVRTLEALDSPTRASSAMDPINDR